MKPLSGASGVSVVLSNGDEWFESGYTRFLERENHLLADFKKRVEGGCRCCGTMNQVASRSNIHAILNVDDEENLDPPPFKNHSTGQVLSEAQFSLCDSCIRMVLLHAFHYMENSTGIHEMNEYWRRNREEEYSNKIQRLEKEVTRQKELRRSRDAKRREQRRKNDQAKRLPTIAQRVQNGEWDILRVVFSEDSAGTKLINLIAHPATPEGERRTAITKLEGRRIRWQQTTSSETRNTRPATKSARSLASSLGG